LEHPDRLAVPMECCDLSPLWPRAERAPRSGGYPLQPGEFQFQPKPLSARIC